MRPRGRLPSLGPGTTRFVQTVLAAPVTREDYREAPQRGGVSPAAAETLTLRDVEDAGLTPHSLGAAVPRVLVYFLALYHFSHSLASSSADTPMFSSWRPAIWCCIRRWQASWRAMSCGPRQSFFRGL